MLQLKKIVKQYGNGENSVTALNGVNLTFRENEFVAILGHSGCGKTTMLNIIGGLDHYTSGDLIINGISTKDYKSKDWDAYRNHSIGFIFQSYNLIPHQTVLANVELALTISGVSKSERKKRAIAALEQVGLGNQLHKKPNQMSGGQMQRVAIARALINNPDILLADEPTGALDSETSIQVMELLKQIAKDKLVIMVTHNPELAEQYANRIVKIKDGTIISDSNPYTPETEKKATLRKDQKKRVSMSFLTATSLSLNNLMTKKGRTLLTSFAGSIGIIGIALILALSTGINNYIEAIQEDTLSSYPLEIERESTDTTSLMQSIMSQGTGEGEEETEREGVYANTDVYEIFNSFNSSATQTNNMKAFKEYISSNEEIQENASAISYQYAVQMPIFTEDPNGNIVKSDFMETYNKAFGMEESESMKTMESNSSLMSMSPMGNVNIWEELLPAENGDPVNSLLYNQYDLVYGSWPQNYDEVVVVLSKDNALPDIVLYALGMKEEEKLPEILTKAMKGEVVTDYGQTKWSYADLCEKEFKLILPCEYYQKNKDSSGYTDLTKNETGLDVLYHADDVGTKLKIIGFIRPNEEANFAMINGYIGYTNQLTAYVMEQTNNSAIVKEQQKNPDTDILLGVEFASDEHTGKTDAEKIADAKNYLTTLQTEQKAEVYRYLATLPNEAEVQTYVDQTLSSYTRAELEAQITEAYAQEMGVDKESVTAYIQQMDDETLYSYLSEAIQQQYTQQYQEQVNQQLSDLSTEQLAAMLDPSKLTDAQYVAVFDQFTPEVISQSTYEENMSILGYASQDDPSAIRIYAKTFRDKDTISNAIADYNDSVPEEDQIHYTDYVALLMSSITDIISGISYLLIAFVGISLVVSSIMIGIITYISVLERTREIGILRAMGASKHDVSTVFNAETLLVGLTSGVIGIGVSLLAIIPINAIIYGVTGIEGLKAFLPPLGAVILVAISMFLTWIAGLIPAKIAAKKDPVEALRTE